MDGFCVKSEAFAFELSDSEKGFRVKPEAFAFSLTGSNYSNPTNKYKFQIKPEAYAVIGASGSGFQINPEAYAVIGAPLPEPVESSFHVKPELFAFDCTVDADNGFRLKPEAFAFDFVPSNDSGFHIKPEAFAFNLVISEKQTVLRLAIRHNGENMILPFTMTATAPAVAIRWNGVNWYNPLVSPSSDKASAVLIKYKGQTLALST